MENPPMLETIAEDPVLSHTKIIAEAWDAGGAYQVGWFPGGRWAEWNDHFRDDMRRFWSGADFAATAAATRFTGSADLYHPSGRKPFHSINYITCHDGFTLNDLVSYSRKHNEANGEENRDGTDNNISGNYGAEGPTDNPAVEKVRVRLIKNFFLSLLLSQGTPMVLAGDEFRRTQGGNNNAYCHDDSLTWLNWGLKERNAEIFSFFRKTVAFRKAHPVFRRTDFFHGADHDGDSFPDIAWMDRTGKTPDWQNLNKFLAFFLDGHRTETNGDRDDVDFFILCNPDSKDISAVLPPSRGGQCWYRVIDTSVPYPGDFLSEGEGECLAKRRIYVLPARSMAVLCSGILPGKELKF
jgi:glycogen operon protein